MTAATTNAPESAPPTSAGGAFSNILSTAIDVAGAKVDDWTNKLNDVATGGSKDPSAGVDAVADKVAEGGDAKQQAGTRGVQAGLQGKNPVWAAIKGAWAGGGPKVRAAVVTAAVGLVLLTVLSPVLLLVFLLTMLIVAAVSKARSSSSEQ